MTSAQRLRELAAWYREFAEKTENPWIWAARVRMAKALEAEARLVERRPGALVLSHGRNRE